jgi:catechol 2,3-dioxygenase-like lactoylglutathione lyase family enzyme
VSDIPRAQSFYAPILEFMGYSLVEKRDARLAWSAASPVGLQWVILTAAHAGHSNPNHDRYSLGLHHFAWNADSRAEVDALHRILVDLGLTVLDPPAEYDYEPGYYAVFFADPDGLKLELVHVPQVRSPVSPTHL